MAIYLHIRFGMEEIINLDPEEILAQLNLEEFQKIYNKFLSHVEKMKENGPTAKLWMQYFDMITIAKQFIVAERSGNWKLHLESIRRMIPFFHSSGHFLYAKSSQIYLQDM